MEVGIARKSTVWALRILSLALIIVCTVIWRLWGAAAAIAIALLLDRFWPKWARELTWQDISTGVGNLAEFGFDGGRLHLRLNGRTLFIYRDTKKERLRLAVILFVKEWGDAYGSQEKLRALGQEVGASCSFGRAYGGHTCMLVPKGDLQTGCLEVLRRLIRDSDAELSSDALARVDSARRPPWQRYDDVSYSDV